MKAKEGCPFCGFLNVQVIGPSETGGQGFQTECTNCGARGPLGMIDKKAAIHVWDNGDVASRTFEFQRPHIEPLRV